MRGLGALHGFEGFKLGACWRDLRLRLFMFAAWVRPQSNLEYRQQGVNTHRKEEKAARGPRLSPFLCDASLQLHGRYPSFGLLERVTVSALQELANGAVEE